MRKHKALRVAVDLLIITLGSALFACAVSLILEPFRIVPGGLTGVAMLIHSKWDGMSVGTMTLLLNVPLIVLSVILLGRRFLLYTAYGTVVSSVLINVSARFEPWFSPGATADHMLVAVAGGALMGLGLGLVFLRGATTGGSDIISRLLKLVFPHIQIGRIIFVIDGLVVLVSMLVYGEIWVGLYAAIVIFITSQVMDAILYGMSTERVAYIISEKPGDIAQEIGARLGRGCTFLHGEGAYSRDARTVILCAVKRQQISLFKSIVISIDPDAFFILSEANEVLGEGFKAYDKHGL